MITRVVNLFCDYWMIDKTALDLNFHHGCASGDEKNGAKQLSVILLLSLLTGFPVPCVGQDYCYYVMTLLLLFCYCYYCCVVWPFYRLS